MRVKYKVYAGNDYGACEFENDPRLKEYSNINEACLAAIKIADENKMQQGDYIHVDERKGNDYRTIGIIMRHKRQFPFGFIIPV